MRGGECSPREPRIVFAITEDICRTCLVCLDICDVSSVLHWDRVTTWAEQGIRRRKKRAGDTYPILSEPREELAG